MSNFFTDFLADAKQRPSYWATTAKLDFARAVWHEMQRQNINQKQLAEKMGISPSMMTRIMKGDHNATIETMTKAAFALGMKIDICLAHKEKQTHIKQRDDVSFFADSLFLDDQASNDGMFTPLKIV